MNDRIQSARASNFTGVDSKKHDTSLIQAIRYHKNLKIIKELLKQGFDVNVADNKGDTPLMQAIRSGKKLVFKELLGRGADVNARNHAGNTPLILATRYDRDLEVIKKLLDHGADINVKNDTGDTALTFAARYSRKLNVIKELLNSGADPNEVNHEGSASMALAIKHGRKLEVIIELRSHGAYVNITKDRGHFPLNWAIRYGRLTVIKQLLKWGAKVNARDDIGNTPLLLATRYLKRFEVIKELLDHGADIDVYNDAGDTPLILAIKYCRKLKVIYELIHCGANINAQNIAGDTPLILAIKYCRKLKVIYEFIHCGADINAQNNSGDTPLILALKCCKNLELIKDLLNRGADANSSNSTGDTPISLAIGYKDFKKITKHKESGQYTYSDIFVSMLQNPIVSPSVRENLQIIKILLTHAANVNVVNNMGDTPLSQAMKNRNYQLCRELLSHGADVNFANGAGMTPLQQAFQQYKSCRTFCLAYNGQPIISYIRNTFGFHYYELIIQNYFIQNVEKDTHIINVEDLLGACEVDYWSKFKKKCLCEIEKMKEDKINDNISLYKLVTTKDMNIVSLPDDAGAKYTVSEVLAAEYPTYCDLIPQKLKYARVRGPLLSALQDLHVYTNSSVANEGLENKKVVLIPDVTLVISKYLSNNDLHNFILSFSNFNQCFHTFSKASCNSATGAKRQFGAESGETSGSSCRKRAKL